MPQFTDPALQIFNTIGYQGLIQGRWIGWLAYPPLGCTVSIIFFALSDLLEQTVLVNEVYDEVQINHSDRVNRE